jgi:UDP-N-acetyl-D-mannosaminuronic acid dehydrogenase
MKICVLGLGYIGLPTSLLLANAGNNVLGVDINNKIVEKLSKRELPFEEPGLQELFEKAKNNFVVNKMIKSSDVYIIAVPTPLENEMKVADLSAVKSASEQISNIFQDGQMVILESTVPPGTSENFVLPILRKSGTKTIYYAHCPERAIPGRTLYEIAHNDRIIGGLNKESAEKAKDLYSSFVKGNIYITDCKTAEFVKLMENTFRDINIALANELSLMAEETGINVWRAIELANKHPRVNILKPGPGVGGHCIAIDPLFLVAKSSKARIVTLAREINNFMPIHVIKLASEMIKDVKNPIITLLGLAYKGNVDDVRESPTFKIKKIAENEGITIKIYDPLVKNYPEKSATLGDAVKDSDCLVLITDHEIFKEIDPKKLRMRHKNLIDTRNILDHGIWRKNGFNIKILGDGTSSFESSNL